MHKNLDLKQKFKFNCVRRDLVFKRLREEEKFKGYFSIEELYALEWVYEQLYMYDPVQKRKVYFENGVHQGSILAPFLFDIYFDQLIEELQREVRFKMLFRKCRRKYVEKDLAYQQLRWTKIFAYADDVAIATFGPQASWIVEKFMELAHKFNFKINIAKSYFISNFKNVEQKYDLKGITRKKCFKYLGVLISAKGSIESHRQLIKKRIQFLCNQVISLNKFLPIRHLTQLWNSFIKPHFDYVAPLMGYFSLSHVNKWKQLYRQSIKRTLQLLQYLPNEELDKIWKQFGFRPSTLLEPTLQQANRFQEEIKRTQQPIAKSKLLLSANEFWQQWRDLNFDQGHINNEIQKKGEKERLITSNLKIKYIPNQGYLERFKHSWKQCKCGERWTFKHLEMHDIVLKNEYEALEDEINSYLLSGSQIYQLQFYQDYICKKIQALNARLFKLVESNTIALQSLHSRI